PSVKYAGLRQIDPFSIASPVGPSRSNASATHARFASGQRGGRSVIARSVGAVNHRLRDRMLLEPPLREQLLIRAVRDQLVERRRQRAAQRGIALRDAD